MLRPTINPRYPIPIVPCLLVEIINIVNSSVESISSYPYATDTRRYLFAHLKDNMQHHVLPCVDMKRETVPRVTSVVRYDLYVVRNGLLCLTDIDELVIP